MQRIRGQKVQPGLRFFGQAIDGDIDLGEDGLPDIVIGSQGAAVVLRYLPITTDFTLTMSSPTKRVEHLYLSGF